MTIQRYIVASFFLTLATAIIVSYLFMETKPPFWLIICSKLALFVSIIASAHEFQYNANRPLTKLDALIFIGVIALYVLVIVTSSYVKPFVSEESFKIICAFLLGGFWVFILTSNWHKVVR